MDRIDEIKPTDLSGIENTLNDIDSHIDIISEEIKDNISLTEKEICSDIIRKSKDLEASNISTRQLVRQKAKKLEENTQKLADRQDLTDKMIEREVDSIEEELE